MRVKKYLLPVYLCLIALVSIAVLLSVLGILPMPIAGQVAGTQNPKNRQETIPQDKSASDALSPLSGGGTNTSNSNTLTASGNQSLPHIPDGPAYAAGIQSAPSQVTEGELATFSWYVNGLPTEIHTTTIYAGRTTTTGKLDTNVSPLSTEYSEWSKDFINGSYKIPLNFTSSLTLESAGTYFARPYAEIDGKHIWGEEVTVTVIPKPRHEVRIINPPARVNSGEGITFTWDVTGPGASTWYTVVVAGRQSRPGALDESVSIPQTPYAVIQQDFTNKEIQIPLRFIGTARAGEPGIYYWRAMALIGQKQIWSDEYSYTAE